MAKTGSEDQDLRTQIESISAELYPTTPIEKKIANALAKHGEFHESISADELQVILRNIVFTMFAQQKIAGFDVGLVHNVAEMNVKIENDQAFVDCVVHIHKPIVAFIEFDYTLVNDTAASQGQLCLKKRSLIINEKTRRFDIKAKAALKAINVEKVTRQELSDLSRIIVRTLPPQLRRHGVKGELNHVGLALEDDVLNVYLEGEFEYA